MKKTIWGMALSASLLSGAALADVEDYVKAGYTMDQVLTNAMRDGLSLQESVGQALAAAPQQANAIIAAGVAIDPASAQSVVDAAVLAGVDPEQAVDAALIGGADPSSVTAPTAAGKSLARRGPPENLPAPPWSNAGGVGNGCDKGRKECPSPN